MPTEKTITCYSLSELKEENDHAYQRALSWVQEGRGELLVENVGIDIEEYWKVERKPSFFDHGKVYWDTNPLDVGYESFSVDIEEAARVWADYLPSLSKAITVGKIELYDAGWGIHSRNLGNLGKRFDPNGKVWAELVAYYADGEITKGGIASDCSNLAGYISEAITGYENGIKRAIDSMYRDIYSEESAIECADANEYLFDINGRII